MSKDFNGTDSKQPEAPVYSPFDGDFSPAKGHKSGPSASKPARQNPGTFTGGYWEGDLTKGHADER